MNRAEMTVNVLKLEAAARQLTERAKALRNDLDADARAELEEQGTAPTWRLNDIGTWSLPVSKEAPVVEDPPAFVEWVKGRWPSEVVEVVNPPFQRALLARLSPVGEGVVDERTGELVPGLGVRPGGVPKTLTFRPAGDALAVADQMADKLVADLTAALGIGGDA